YVIRFLFAASDLKGLYLLSMNCFSFLQTLKIKGGIIMKGVILAGGTGSRLFPITTASNKHLLPVFDKPMIYYPLSVLMLSGLTEIMIICTPEDRSNFEQLLGDGSSLGMTIVYEEQTEPNLMHEALNIAQEVIKGDDEALNLDDNTLHGHRLTSLLSVDIKKHKHVSVFSYRERNPELFGVVELNTQQKVISPEENPYE